MLDVDASASLPGALDFIGRDPGTVSGSSSFWRSTWDAGTASGEADGVFATDINGVDVGSTVLGGDRSINSVDYWSFGVSGTNNDPNPGFLKLGLVYDTIQFLWGSVDTYNKLWFYKDDVEVGYVQGQDLLNEGATQSNGAALVTFVIAGGFDTLKFLSDGKNAFEVSNFSAVAENIGNVPLPPAALLLGSLVGGLGLFGARRRRAGKAI